jgi:hypothetical protein
MISGKELVDRKRKITAIMNSVSFATEEIRQKTIEMLTDHSWTIDHIYKMYENFIQPQDLESVKKALK